MRAVSSNNISSRKILVVQIALALGISHGLNAGFANAQTPPAASSDTAKTIEEIVVTAQRRPENKQNVSVSVTAVTAETLTERNITDLSKMEGMAPGFTFGRSGTDARPAMRGVRTENVAINGIPLSATLWMASINHARNKPWQVLWMCSAWKSSVARRARCMAAILSAAISLS